MGVRFHPYPSKWEVLCCQAPGSLRVSIVAVQHVRRLRGGAQSQLMRCSDGYLYVVKFQNNPQHRRVLVNEMLVTRIAERLGLPVPTAQVVEVREWLIRHSSEMTIQLARSTHSSTG